MSLKDIGKLSRFISVSGACVALTLGIAACNKNQTADNSPQTQPAQTDQTQAPDQTQASDQTQSPAATANLAPVSDTQEAAPSDQGSNDYDADAQDADYGQSEMQASDPPPPLPEYSQPECPGQGYIWTPGVLELRFARLLLGAGGLVAAAGIGLFVDAGILGICGRKIPLPLWILGAAHWLLRRN